MRTSVRRRILVLLSRGRPMRAREIADTLGAYQRTVANECSLMVIEKGDSRSGYTAAVRMLPGDREKIAELARAYGPAVVGMVAYESIEPGPVRRRP